MAILRKFPIVFVVLALVLAAVFALLERNRERQAENQSWVSHTAQVLAELSSMEAALMESELAARGQLVSGDKRYDQVHQQAEAAMHKQLDLVSALTADNPSQVERSRALRETVKTSTAASRKLIEIREQQGEAAAARAFSETDPERALEAARIQIRQMSDEEHTLLASRAERLYASERALLIASVGCALLLITAYLLLRRDAIQRHLLEQQLVRKNSKLADASRLKSEFLAHMRP
jgi:CHASE3 domain sensor protein